MRSWTHVLAMLLAAPLQGQQTQSPQPPPRPSPAISRPQAQAQEPLVIYQIDLIPSGTAFSLGKPTLEGDAWVFKAWPDRAVAHLPQVRVKKITARTKDLNKEVVFQVDLVPSGRVIARENPVLKGKTYVLYTWRDGTLMSLRQEDVRKITRVTGIPAFKIQQEERGAARIDNLPMEGTGNVTVINKPPEAPASAPDPSTAPGNWSYQGQPGVTDAYAPPSAVVSSPGDVPKAAPTPQPH